jgi:hypothetical protein
VTSYTTLKIGSGTADSMRAETVIVCLAQDRSIHVTTIEDAGPGDNGSL